jgi:hypothetical protein
LRSNFGQAYDIGGTSLGVIWLRTGGLDLMTPNLNEQLAGSSMRLVCVTKLELFHKRFIEIGLIGSAFIGHSSVYLI